MRKIILFGALTLAMAALAVFLPGSARSAAHGTSLPFKGRVANHVTIDMNTGELQTYEDSLPFTHLGLRTAVSTGWAFPDGAGGFILSGTVTGTAANGDHLFAALTTDRLVFTGGTGRFEGATGYLVTVSEEITNMVISDDGILSADVVGYDEGVLNLNRP